MTMWPMLMRLKRIMFRHDPFILAGGDKGIGHILLGTNAKFEKRFAYIEKTLSARGIALKDAGLDQMDALWNEAKTRA